jgi:hypothetical protein
VKLLWDHVDLEAYVDLDWELEAQHKQKLLADTVQWPGQPWLLALAVAHGLRDLRREFYHPFQTSITGVTDEDLELLARLAGLGDWLAEDRLRDVLIPKAGAVEAEAAAKEQRKLERLKQLPGATLPTSCNAVAHGTWLWKFGSPQRAKTLWQQYLADVRVRAVCLFVDRGVKPTDDDLATPLSFPPDVARDLLVKSNRPRDLQELARRLDDKRDFNLAATVYHSAGLTFIGLRDGDAAAECLAEAARRGHERAALTYLQQRGSHSSDETRLQALVDAGPRPAQSLILALAQCRFSRGDLEGAKQLLMTPGNQPKDLRCHGQALVRMGLLGEEELAQQLLAFQEHLTNLMS